MKNIYSLLFYLFILSAFCISCKTKPILQKQAEKDNFLGIYTVRLPGSKYGAITYSVEFKSDKTARVLIFKDKEKTPQIRFGKWLITKSGIITLYFTELVPSEFFKKNADGSLSFLNEQKQEYSGGQNEILKLKRID